mmetsp:Transcript_82575/g.256503  ORF Transcript_82575/g.256503 Transcript_82575/m.256503 type:complete len:226 (+) Transcript_82575:823-1500(+)
MAVDAVHQALCLECAAAVGVAVEDGAQGHPHRSPRGDGDARGLPAGDLLVAQQDGHGRGEDGQCRLPSAGHHGVLVLQAQEEASLRERKAGSDEEHARHVLKLRQPAALHTLGDDAKDGPHHGLPHQLEHQRARPVDPELRDKGATAEEHKDDHQRAVHDEDGRPLQAGLLLADVAPRQLPLPLKGAIGPLPGGHWGWAAGGSRRSSAEALMHPSYGVVRYVGWR